MLLWSRARNYPNAENPVKKQQVAGEKLLRLRGEHALESEPGPPAPAAPSLRVLRAAETDVLCGEARGDVWRQRYSLRGISSSMRTEGRIESTASTMRPLNRRS